MYCLGISLHAHLLPTVLIYLGGLNGWQLAQVTAEQHVHATERFVEAVLDLSHAAVHLGEKLRAHHAHLVDD